MSLPVEPEAAQQRMPAAAFLEPARGALAPHRQEAAVQAPERSERPHQQTSEDKGEMGTSPRRDSSLALTGIRSLLEPVAEVVGRVTLT